MLTATGILNYGSWQNGVQGHGISRSVRRGAAGESHGRVDVILEQITDRDQRFLEVVQVLENVSEVTQSKDLRSTGGNPSWMSTTSTSSSRERATSAAAGFSSTPTTKRPGFPLLQLVTEPTSGTADLKDPLRARGDAVHQKLVETRQSSDPAAAARASVALPELTEPPAEGSTDPSDRCRGRSASDGYTGH
jgi:hypothetical protein